MFDIITFGSATQDIIVRPKKLTVLQYNAHETSDKNIAEVCFPMGSKVEIEQIGFYSGGGGTNTAATFALQGFSVSYWGMIGNDISGKEIITQLKSRKIDTSFIQTTDKKVTNHSIIISSEGTDRTILAYRGAAELLDKDIIPWKKLKAKWLYLAPLTGLLCDSFEELVDYAKDHGMQVAINPSMAQLSMPMEQLKPIFAKVDVLFLNQEEASFLTKIPMEQEQEIFKAIDELCPGVAVMTKGGDGVVVSDGKYVYSAKPSPNRVVVDTLGAGDSFASGFLTDYIRENGNIEKAIQLGMANSQACLSQIGAKNGLLKKGDPFDRVPVTKRECDNNVCIVK